MRSPIKIYLADLVHNYLPGNYTVPLNIANIAIYVKEIFGADLEIKLFKFPDDLLQRLKENKPDILGFSNYIWNNDLNFQIGKFIKKNYPDTLIVMGGPAIRIDTAGIKSFLVRNSFVDAYMMFEGEQPFANFFKAVSDNGKNLFSKNINIEGCAYLSDEDLVYSPISNQLDLSRLPSAYLSGILDKFIDIELIPLFESNRGCPFNCTYCTWGIGSLKKLRTFSLERLFEEMGYVAERNPNIPCWIFADANFGILERDVDIARKISDLQKKNPALNIVSVWWSKNTNERNLEIAKLIKGSQRKLIAVQTLDRLVAKNIKRENISTQTVAAYIERFKKAGFDVCTDILCGLPGESSQSHFDTLRSCFDLGFEALHVANTILIPGSEMETDESRSQFKIRSKYRLREGSFGVYNGIKSIESEEVILTTLSATKQEILNFRLIHWLIWYSWNANFLKPLMLYLQFHNHIHPLDFIIIIANADKSNFLNVKNMFKRFLQEAKEEWFDSPSELKKFYMRPQKLDHLLKYGFPKMNFKYTAELISNLSLHKEFCDFIACLVSNLTPSTFSSDMIMFIKEMIIDINEIMNKESVSEKTLKISKEYLPFILDNFDSSKILNNSYAEITLYKEKKDINFTKKLLEKYALDGNKNFAIEKALEYSLTAFSYNVKYSSKEDIPSQALIKDENFSY